jgi:HSP20 family protein
MLKIFSSPKENPYQITPGSFSDLNDRWLNDASLDGQLLLDVYETPHNVFVKAIVAGVKSEDLDITLHNDLLTIKGKIEMNESEKDTDYILQECYFGSFSRSLILPAEVDEKKIKADLENGILTVTLEKIKDKKETKIKIRE